MTIQLHPNEQAIIECINETQRNIARIIRVHRAVLDINQSDYGARIGLHQTQISDLENNGTLGLDLFIRVAHGLGVSPSDLLKAAEQRELTVVGCAFSDAPNKHASK